MEVLDLVNKGKVKRLFRAREKIAFAGATCHITQRAGGKEPLFLEDNDYLHMIHLIKEKAKAFSFEVFCFSLMPNHLHILIQLSENNLSNAMKRLYEDYAKFFNSKYQRKGHVFGGPFRQALCFDDCYLLAASIYIHLNAVRGRLVNAPQDYRWSSCRLYVAPFDKKTFLNYEFILGILDKDITQARKLYKEMLDKANEIKIQETWENPKALESFKIKVKRFFPNLIQRRSESGDKLVDTDFLKEEELEKKISQLKMKRRLRSPESLQARRFLIEQLQARGYTMDVIAQRLNISRQTVYNTLNFTKSAMLKM